VVTAVGLTKVSLMGDPERAKIEVRSITYARTVRLGFDFLINFASNPLPIGSKSHVRILCVFNKN